MIPKCSAGENREIAAIQFWINEPVDGKTWWSLISIIQRWRWNLISLYIARYVFREHDVDVIENFPNSIFEAAYYVRIGTTTRLGLQRIQFRTGTRTSCIIKSVHRISMARVTNRSDPRTFYVCLSYDQVNTVVTRKQVIRERESPFDDF